jgi:hypothetical protein
MQISIAPVIPPITTPLIVLFEGKKARTPLGALKYSLVLKVE